MAESSRVAPADDVGWCWTDTCAAVKEKRVQNSVLFKYLQSNANIGRSLFKCTQLVTLSSESSFDAGCELASAGAFGNCT